jgi:hypothetical protein
MAGARVSPGGGELAGRLGGDVHRESFGLVAESCSLPGLDQRDREPAQRSPPANTKDLPLARRQDGAALGRRGTAHDRTEFSRIMGCRDLWMLKAALDENQTALKKQVA